MKNLEKIRIILENKIESFLHKDRRRLMVKIYKSNFPFRSGYYFKLLYFPTGASMADNSKYLPASVITKIRSFFKSKNVSFEMSVEYENDIFTMQKYSYSVLYLSEENLKKLYEAFEEI